MTYKERIVRLKKQINALSISNCKKCRRIWDDPDCDACKFGYVYSEEYEKIDQRMPIRYNTKIKEGRYENELQL